MDELTYFNPSFKFPRNLRLSLGTDIALPWDLVGTVDLLYIRGVDQLDVIDVNLSRRPPSLPEKPDAYCTARFDSASDRATPNRKSGGFRVGGRDAKRQR